MQVIIVSEKKQQFNGKNYYCGNGRYFRRITNPRKDGTPAKSFLLHREVWEYHNGPIPEKMTIHHIDFDWRNNQIDNLVPMTMQENLKLQSPENTEKRRQHIERIRPLAKKWHGTPEGKAWHARNAKKAWMKRELTMKICDFCGDEYATYFPDRAKFCHLNCKMAAFRKRRRES